MRSLIDRNWLSSERGVVLPFVALALVGLMGAAALAIDVGNAWLTRRDLIIATDAAALAGAQEQAQGGDGCSAAATVFATINSPSATFSCSVSAGYVTVDGSDTAEVWFAQVLGFADNTVTATTSALWAPPGAVTGLRPIGLCFEGSSALQSLINNPPPAGTTTTIRIDYDKDQPDACGGTMTPGNWGVIDFDAGANSNNDTKDWIVNGYPGPVVFSNHPVTSCAGEPHCYEGDTGALAGINNELSQLQASGIFFTVPVFNFVENPGANALFHLMGVLRVRLIDYRVNGNPNNRHFTFEVQPGLITGTVVGGSGPGDNNNSIIAICSVDPGEVDACSP